MTSSFDPPQVISHQWVIGTKPLSQTVFKIFPSKDNQVTTLTILGHRRHRSRDCSILCIHFYRCPIVTESLSRAVFEITGLKDIGVTTLTFQGHVTLIKVTLSMTSSFNQPQAFSSQWLIVSKLLSQSISRYLHLNVTGSRLLAFLSHTTSSVT